MLLLIFSDWFLLNVVMFCTSLNFSCKHHFFGVYNTSIFLVYNTVSTARYVENFRCVSFQVLLLRIYLIVPHISWYQGSLICISLSQSYDMLFLIKLKQDVCLNTATFITTFGRTGLVPQKAIVLVLSGEILQIYIFTILSTRLHVILF